MDQDTEGQGAGGGNKRVSAAPFFFFKFFFFLIRNTFVFLIIVGNAVFGSCSCWEIPLVSVEDWVVQF